MHALHCILVEVDSLQVNDFLQTKDNSYLDDIKAEARAEAMEATHRYCDIVFTWRTEDDAGRWADKFPDEGVILGVLEPERFKELLQKFSQKPLEAALKYMDRLKYIDCAYRSKSVLENDPNIVIIDVDNTPVNQMGEQYFWSGRPNSGVVINKDLVKKIWDEQFRWADIWPLVKALQLVTGDYCFDSQFYSVPDGEAKISEGILKEALEHPERYALVFSDYHI
ncbi:hypothetical protein MTAT_19460 [Moorella thermoacetica]|uniref:Uncharacterized protein n=1 Tax=Neomoorella thermoacetica TaxID=1525 RepID=A0AAC9HIY6_NEOTH|nr:hypothetical protein [Moorella thermoacetica]AOQ24603.1 hypothetical protein Maut_02173 [Moorella thermoacetica]TYL12704.1 hypothetical protein MTAT_19460 [Moorella thermoacetica]